MIQRLATLKIKFDVHQTSQNRLVKSENLESNCHESNPRPLAIAASPQTTEL